MAELTIVRKPLDRGRRNAAQRQAAVLRQARRPMRHSAVLGAALFLSIALFAPGCTSREDLAWQTADGYRVAELHVKEGGRAGFQQLAPKTTGIDFVNSLTPAQIDSNQVLLDGSGVAIGDVDGDGWADIYFARLNGPNVLYRNLGNWTFADITAEAGVALGDRFSTGAVLADVDGDGDLDLLVTALGGPNALLFNDGTGRFTELPGRLPPASTYGSTTAALADIDGDGDLDLYIANYKRRRVRDIYGPGETTFEKLVVQTGDTYAIAAKFRDHYSLDINGTILRWHEDAEPDHLYLNDGRGNFEQVTVAGERFLDEDGNPVPAFKDWGLTARFQDMDGDGDPDIYVCNDFASPDRIWINDGRGYFRAIGRLALRHTSQASMSVAFIDANRDGHLDFFLADMLSRDHQRRKTQMGDMQPTPLTIGEIDNRPQIMRNTFFLNRGDGTYAEIARYSGLHASEWTWSAIAVDVDLDGYEDLLASTGHAYDVMDSDTQQRIDRMFTAGLLPHRNAITLYPRLELRNMAFRNNGDLTFQEIGADWGLGSMDISHGMALGDLDNDGDLDLVINRYQAPAAVYRNVGSAPRVAVRLKGEAPNTQGIGAKVRLLGGVVAQETEVVSGGTYLSGSESLTVFAAGNRRSDLSIEVTWRNGRRTIIDGVEPNHIYEIAEAGAVDSAPPPAAEVTPFFEDRSDLLRHVHHEDPFDDFARQPLLPNRLSQLGPGVAWSDLNGDGYDDLVISSGKGGRLAYFENDGQGAFRSLSQSLPAGESSRDQTAIIGWAPQPGATSLLVAQTNFEDPDSGPSAVARYDRTDGRFRAVDPVPGDVAGAGPLALADVDGDGDLDLFVGGRTIPGSYPAPPSSRLYRNAGGHFAYDADLSRPLRNIGMVTGAVFSDLDGDGDPDLVLALEWGPVTILRNEGGRFVDVTADMGLEGYRGWWNGVTTGDLDEDGRPDIIATNWGLNSKYRADPDHPLRILYRDFDVSGSLDIVEAHFDAGMNGMVPERGLSCMIDAMPLIRERTPTFRQYGGSTLNEIMGDLLRKAPEVQASTLAHTVFFNRGDHFEAVPLPAEAQFAPAFAANVGDFDGDGHDDIFLSQNFFASQIETPRIDAGRGLWLQGDGTGRLVPVSGQISGVKVYGEQRGAALADYDRDGRVDLVVTQNGAATKLFHNLGARPGLLVRLAGPPENPWAVGAAVRLIYADGAGPSREVHAGSGYWSQDSPVQVLGTRGQPRSVRVTWPGGETTESLLPQGVLELSISTDGALEVISYQSEP
ncbi:MAG: VCBS repeat-containing protein [Candidatus Marinimicrobia bacterium]|nr:VCBS repeat-containing protein [Candidatus Neomarinimicrobiota bacterium]